MDSIPPGICLDSSQSRAKLGESGVTLREGEGIKYFYDASGGVFIVLTNFRFLKLENRKSVSISELSAIKGVKHIKAGFFAWDKVEVTEKSGRVETFGIYYSIVAAFFTRVLQDGIGKPLEIIERKIEGETCCLYVLLCEDDCRYVGKAAEEKEVPRRFEEHKSDSELGAAFTKTHRPKEIEEIIPHSSPYHEDAKVLELMAIHGVDKVRGGSYSQETLTQTQMEAITSAVRGATDVCLNCGKKGHFIKNCPKKREGKGPAKEIPVESETSDWFVIPSQSVEKKGRVDAPKARTRWTLQDHQKMLDLVAEGKSHLEVSKLLGRTERAIKMRLQQLACRLKNNGKSDKEIWEVTRFGKSEIEEALLGLAMGKLTL